MKKFLTVTLLVLSMMIFVSCGDSDDETDTGDTGNTVSDSDSDTGDSTADEEKTDTGDQTNDEENNTPGLPDDDEGDSTNDEEATDTGDSTDDGDNTDTGDNNEVIDDSNCETVVYKSMDVRKMDVNEIDIWLYDTETYEDYTDPLFFIEAHFAKNVTELKGATISLQNLDPNKDDSTRVFFYTDFNANMEIFTKNYIAKSGSFHIEDIDADDYMKLKIDTTAIVFYELLIDEENGVYTEPANGKCYKLEPFEWNSID